MTTTTMDRDYPLSRYPIAVSVEAQAGDRNRLTTCLRPILAIPHMILVGPGAWLHRLDSAGLIGAAAYVLAIVNWFAILVTGDSIKGIRDFQLYYLRWRVRAVAYMALFVDPYPPFGDGLYPATIAVTEPTVRDRATPDSGHAASAGAVLSHPRMGALHRCGMVRDSVHWCVPRVAVSVCAWSHALDAARRSVSASPRRRISPIHPRLIGSVATSRSAC
jgi:hypothetical protein